MPRAKQKRKVTKKETKNKNKSYVIQDTGNRGAHNYVRYKIPKYSKNQTAATIEGIQQFANERSRKMLAIPILQNASVSIALKFNDGSWVSTQHTDAGDSFDLEEIWEEYGDKKSGRRVVAFSFLFTV